MKLIIKCPVCLGKGEIEEPANIKDIKKEATLILRKNKFGIK